MITLTLVHRALTQQELDEFLKSLSYSNSGEYRYEVISENDSPVFSEKAIERVNVPSADSIIDITLADDCIVLGNAWDKYIHYAFEHGLPQGGLGKNYVPSWEGTVIRRMALQTRRPPDGIFPDLKVTVATK